MESRGLWELASGPSNKSISRFKGIVLAVRGCSEAERMDSPAMQAEDYVCS